MIFGLLKEETIKEPKIPPVFGNRNKIIAKANEVLFEIEVNKEFDNGDYKLDYKFISPTKKYYIFDEADVIAKIELENSKLLIISK